MDYMCEQGLSLVIAMDEILKQSAKRREVAATVAISLGLLRDFVPGNDRKERISLNIYERDKDAYFPISGASGFVPGPKCFKITRFS